MAGRRDWVVSFVVAVLAAVAVGAVVFTFLREDEESCAEWQERYRAAAESMGVDPGQVSGGTLQFVNMGPFAELEESQPEGCPAPR